MIQPKTGETVVFESGVQMASADAPTQRSFLTITNKGIYFNLETPIFIDFEKIKKVELKGLALTGSRVIISYSEKDSEKQIKFNGFRNGLPDSLRTKLLFETIDKLFKKQEPDLKKIAKTKSADIMPQQPWGWISVAVVLVGFFGGGLVGLLIALLVTVIIRKISLNENYSPRKKLGFLGLAIVFGIALYFVILNILLIVST